MQSSKVSFYLNLLLTYEPLFPIKTLPFLSFIKLLPNEGGYHLYRPNYLYRSLNPQVKYLLSRDDP
jgi:hypothetical protein